MKIAFLLRTFPVLSETFILNQITGLIDQGHEIDIYSIYQGDGETHAAFQEYKLQNRVFYPPTVPHSPIWRIIKLFPLLALNVRYWHQLLPCLNFFRFKRQAQSLYLFYLGLLLINRPRSYDIIHCHFGIAGLVGSDLHSLGLLNGKLVVSFHGQGVNSYVKKNGLDVYQRLFKRGDLYTVNSEFMAHRLSKLGCPMEKVVKLPVGVNLPNFPYHPRTLMPQSTIKVLTVARLVDCKGLEYGIRAVAQIQEHYPNLQYNIIGDGPLKGPLSQLIRQLNADQYIYLLGGKPQNIVQRFYQKAHLFILPSVVGADGSEEGQGLVLQEAQATGLPIISTSIGGIPEGVRDQISGFLVPPRNSQALAAKLEYLINHPEQWALMGQAGHEFVKKQYDLAYLNQQLANLYQGLISDDRNP